MFGSRRCAHKEIWTHKYTWKADENVFTQAHVNFFHVVFWAFRLLLPLFMIKSHCLCVVTCVGLRSRTSLHNPERPSFARANYTYVYVIQSVICECAWARMRVYVHACSYACVCVCVCVCVCGQCVIECERACVQLCVYLASSNMR